MLKNKTYICRLVISKHGELAQLARAPRWQRGGHRFESDILHKPNHENGWVFYVRIALGSAFTGKGK